VVLVFVFVSIDPPQVLFAAFLVYALSGPVMTVVMRSRMRKEKSADAGEDDTDDGSEG